MPKDQIQHKRVNIYRDLPDADFVTVESPWFHVLKEERSCIFKDDEYKCYQSMNKAHSPIHVAIIMDGNGRWAQSRGLPRIEGHRQGIENIREILKVAQKLQIRYLTLYAFSVDNWQRPPEEITALMSLLEHFLSKNLKDLIDHKIRLRIIGRPEQLPLGVQSKLKRALEATKDFSEYQLNVALNYGSRTEVLDATGAYAKAVAQGKEDPQQLDWARFTQYLYTSNIPDPDLLIRTSGETRISNFLVLQCAYAEMYFSPVNWPDFGQNEFTEAIESFKQRERRFGMTGEQIQTQSPQTTTIE